MKSNLRPDMIPNFHPDEGRRRGVDYGPESKTAGGWQPVELTEYLMMNGQGEKFWQAPEEVPEAITARWPDESDLPELQEVCPAIFDKEFLPFLMINLTRMQRYWWWKKNRELDQKAASTTS